MTSATGYNDPSSVYNSGGLSWLTGAADSTAKIISAINPPAPTTTATQQAAQTGFTDKSGWSTFRVVALVAAAVVGIFLLMKAFK